MAASGQIEISTTPYYHPILPLVCDSNIAGVSIPVCRCRRASAIRRMPAGNWPWRVITCTDHFGVAPAGLWPSEGSVSDEVFHIAAELGFEWTATDSGVLNRTLNRAVPVEGLYRPYRWKQGGDSLGVIFRDHFMSDLIGFVYSKMDAAAAAEDFLHRIRDNSAGILASGRDALVPIILDGENAWEYYDRNGRPFFRELYRRISEDGRMKAITVSEALRIMQPDPLDHIFPGSWINANFDVWIGADEDNQAWAQLLRARQTYDGATGVSEEQRRLAFEEILIAEGSDWCWWYGPEHDSANREDFDQLYRSHLANVYRFLNLTPPEELSRPILRVAVPAEYLEPSGPITPTIDGEVTSYFEWIGAGVYRVDERSGSMHGKKFVVSEVQFGTDGANLYFRVDFHPAYLQELNGMEARLAAQPFDGWKTSHITIAFSNDAAHVAESEVSDVACAFNRILEVRIPLAQLGVAPGAGVRFQGSLWQSGLPMDALPPQGWLEIENDRPGPTVTVTGLVH